MAEQVLYHIWFATKKRKWLLQGDIEGAVLEFLRHIADEKGIDLLECGAIVDHVHLLLRVEPQRLAEAIRILKGATSYQVLRRFPEVKLDAGVSSFWQVRYAARAVDPAGVASVRRYIRTQGQRLEKFEGR